MNPYAPPKAPVVDAAPAARLPRPASVTVALILLWINIAIRFSGSIHQLQRVSSGMTSGLPFALDLLGIAVITWVCVMLTLRRNWARFLLLAVTGLLPLNLVGSLLKHPEGAHWIVSLPGFVNAVFPVVAYLIASYLVFVPGRGWFRPRE